MSILKQFLKRNVIINTVLVMPEITHQHHSFDIVKCVILLLGLMFSWVFVYSFTELQTDPLFLRRNKLYFVFRQFVFSSGPPSVIILLFFQPILTKVLLGCFTFK
jgi:hypothetical protein